MKAKCIHKNRAGAGRKWRTWPAFHCSHLVTFVMLLSGLFLLLPPCHRGHHLLLNVTSAMLLWFLGSGQPAAGQSSSS